jgi:flagellar protein FlaI
MANTSQSSGDTEQHREDTGDGELEEGPAEVKQGEKTPLQSERYDGRNVEELLSPLRKQVFDLVDGTVYEVVEERWLSEPYALAAVIQNTETDEYEYHVIQPPLNEGEAEVYRRIMDRLSDLKHRVPSDAKGEERRDYIEAFAREELNVNATDISEGGLQSVLYYVMRDSLRHERLDPLIRDPLLANVAVNGANQPVFVRHRDHGNMVANVSFDEDELDWYAKRLSHNIGQDIANATPTVKGSLDTGAQVELAAGDHARSDASITITKFAETPLSPIELIELGVFTTEQVAYLWLLLQNGFSGIITGRHGVGKTATLNALTMFLPADDRVVSVEQQKELHPSKDNWVATLTRESYTQEGKTVEMEELVSQALNKRPDTLILGDFVGDEAESAFKALNTGVSILGTTKADTVDGVYEQFTTDPLNVDRSRLADLGFVLLLGIEEGEVPDGSVDEAKVGSNARVRRALSITEVEDADQDSVADREIYKWDSVEEAFKNPNQSTHTDHLQEVEYDTEQAFTERYDLLEYLRTKEITDYENVLLAVRAYISNRNIISRIRDDSIDFEELRRTV